MKKYCTKCGKPFEAIGREVICPSCKEHAAEDAKRAAVLKAKRASWTGESVPVRISGRASTVIREYGAEKSLSFAAALDALLKETDCFKSLGMAWEDITPYKSHRRDKAATQDTPQDVKQDTPQDVKQDTPQDVKQDVKPRAVAEFGGFGIVIDGEVKQAAKKATKASTAKKAAKTASVKK